MSAGDKGRRLKGIQMKKITVTYKVVNKAKGQGEEKELTFRTNNNGDYLFVGVAENRQLNCDTGYTNRRKLMKAIREYVTSHENVWGYVKTLSRIKYDWTHF